MESSTFAIDDYDGIGFDLDCTLAEYNVKELIKLVYRLLVDYLAKKKSYESEHLLKSFEEVEYFFQKGLFLDFEKGNIIKMGGKSEILKATHGTVVLSDEEIVKHYGPEKIYSNFKDFMKDPLVLLSKPAEKVTRVTLDCFDMACALIFARMVDHFDKASGEKPTYYSVWSDVLQGLQHFYNRQHFATEESEFFAEIKRNPAPYYKKWTPEKLNWLKEIKSKKFVFLITGSYIDFASLTAGYCIGENWKDYFDFVVCYAKKPLFFYGKQPFLPVVDGKEGGPVKEGGLQVNTVYSQGNWEELKSLISKKTNVENPKCVYFGDNLLLDVYAAVHFKCCDSLAVSLELTDEFKSCFWGPFFGESGKEAPTCWSVIIEKYAKVCVDSLDVFVKKPLDFRYNCLKPGESNEVTENNGYYKS